MGDEQMIDYMREAAKHLRSAIDEHNKMMVDVLAKYDHALKHGDDKQIETESMVLLLMVNTSPIGRELEQIARDLKLLKKVGVYAGSSSLDRGGQGSPEFR